MTKDGLVLKRVLITDSPFSRGGLNVETHINKTLYVHVSLKEEARGRLEGERVGGASRRTLSGVMIEEDLNIDYAPYFISWVSSTSPRLPDVVLQLIELVRYRGALGQNQIVDDGVYHHGKATVIISSGSGVEIIAPDIRSLVEAYARVFPQNVLPERTFA